MHKVSTIICNLLINTNILKFMNDFLQNKVSVSNFCKFINKNYFI